MSKATFIRLCIRLSFLPALCLAAPVAAQEAPPLVGTPDDVVFEFGSPRLVIPDGPWISGASPRTVELLNAALQRETQIHRRIELITHLGASRLSEALPALRSALSADDPQIRAAAARAVGVAGEPSLATELLRRIDDQSPLVRAEVVRAHAALTPGRGEASAAVVAGLADEDPGVRIAAFAVAANEAEARAIAGQVPALQGRLQLAGVEALGRIGAPAGIEAVLPLLRGNVAQQAAAARALAGMKAESHAAAITDLLKVDHPTVRREALDALRQLQEPQTAQVTGVQHLQDPDASVRAVAATMARPVPDSATAQALLKHLRDPYPPLHDAALAALGEPGSDAVREEVVRQAVALLNAGELSQRIDGTRLLGLLRSNAALDAQIAIIQQTTPSDTVDTELVRHTAIALGMIGDARAAPAVRDLANRGVTGIVSESGDMLSIGAVIEALVAAGRLGDRQIVPIAMRIMGSNPEMTPSEPRAAGAWAVGAVGEAGGGQFAGPLLRLVNSQLDNEETQVEAAKAIGRLKLTQAAERLPAIAEGTRSARLRWMTLWAHARITGEALDYEPPTVNRQLRLAVEEVGQ